MSYVEEYDVECAQRKWTGTLAKLEDESYQVIHHVNDDFKFLNRNGDEIARPTYHLFESGYYKYKDTWACLIRSNQKTFKVGLSGDVYWCFFLKGDTWHPLTLTKLALEQIKWNGPRPTPQASLNLFGPLSKKIFVSKSNVFYLTRKIGWRDKNKFVMESSHLIQELRDLTRHLTVEGESCQISAL